jgi:uncharacterized membrane protein YfcA
MHLLEHTLAVLLVCVLLSLAGYYAWRQCRMLRGLGRSMVLGDEDRTYYRRQAWRRLVGCVFMVLIAGFLGAWYVLGPGEFSGGPADPKFIDQIPTEDIWSEYCDAFAAEAA